MYPKQYHVLLVNMVPATPTGLFIALSGEDKHYKDLGEFLKIDVPRLFDSATG